MRIPKLLVSLSLLIAHGAQAQATRVVADTGNYLLQITQGWGRESPLGELVVRAMGREDIEMRLWEGYGLGGVWGLVVRREKGRWRAWHTRIVKCSYSLPIPVGDTLSAPSEIGYRRLARARCAEQNAGEAEAPPGTYGWRVISDDTVSLVSIRARLPLESLWRDALRAGVDRLPTSVPSHLLSTDGYTYVIELRRGPEYRASVIRRTTPPATAADTAVQAVAAVFRRLSRSTQP
ncbi:MAG: hypothetical protein K2R93_19375 [Gemmatimonadaceae bacterium]|nr:hypothetical protein [Gemmatimonadaceae bacterium]